MFEGLLKGRRLDFPITISNLDGLYRNETVFENDKELVDFVYEKIIKDKEKKLKIIFEEIGLSDTMTIIDFRTKQMLEAYKFYRNNPHDAFPNNSVWYEAYGMISNLEPRMF